MTNIEFLKHCLDIGKIDQDRYDKGIAKLQKKDDAKANYKTNKDKLTKAQLQEIIDDIIA